MRTRRGIWEGFEKGKKRNGIIIISKKEYSKKKFKNEENQSPN